MEQYFQGGCVHQNLILHNGPIVTLSMLTPALETFLGWGGVSLNPPKNVGDQFLDLSAKGGTPFRSLPAPLRIPAQALTPIISEGMSTAPRLEKLVLQWWHWLNKSIWFDCLCICLLIKNLYVKMKWKDYLTRKFKLFSYAFFLKTKRVSVLL